MTSPTLTTPTPAAPVEAPSTGVADPGPLGLAAFAMTTFVLSVFNAGIIKDAALETVVLPLALFYGGVAQFAAGMWEFKNRNTFGALAFTSYGAFWLAFAAYVKYVAGGLPAADAYKATGLFLLSWTIFTAYMTVAAMRVNVAVLAVFVLLSLTFLFLTIGAFDTSTTTITKVGGYIGLLTALAAWYGSFAGVVNSTWSKTVLPVRPLS
jgi:succinate-acetate transporter protein